MNWPTVKTADSTAKNPIVHNATRLNEDMAFYLGPIRRDGFGLLNPKLLKHPFTVVKQSFVYGEYCLSE